MSNRLAILIMPRLNANEDEAKVVALPPAAGSCFEEGDTLFSVETTKAANDVIAPCAGRIAKISVALDDMIEVGAPICEVEFASEGWVGEIDFVWADSLEGGAQLAPDSTPHISAKARQRARELGLDIAELAAAGGSVRVADIERHFKAKHKAPSARVTAEQAGLKAEYGNDEVVIFGGSGHARAIIDCARDCGFNLIGAIDRDIPVGTPVLGDVVVLGDESLLDILHDRGVRKAIVGVGGATSNAARRTVYEKLVRLGFDLPPIIAKSAYLGLGSSVGPATYVLPGANVGPNVSIGVNCIVNQNVVVAHDSVIGDDVHLAPNAVVAGHCTIGHRSTLGMCATLINGARIGEDCLIHNNVAVTSDVPDAKVVTLADQVERAKRVRPDHA